MTETPAGDVSKEEVGVYFSKFVRREFGREEWSRIMDLLNYKEEDHPGRRSPRRPQDMSPSLNAERLWLAHGKHMAVVAMRVDTLLGILGVAEDIKKDAVAAAMLHDLTKPDEIQNRPPEGVTWDYYAQVSERGKRLIEQAGFNDRVVQLSGSMGHETLAETRAMLDQGTQDEGALAWYAIHAVDDWSAGDSWATRGAFQARMAKNRTNPQIARLNEEGLERLGGNTTDVQEEIGLRVMEVLAQKVSERSGETVTASDLPLYIDNKLREKMASSTV